MISFELVVQSAAANPEDVSGKLFIASGAGESHADELFFNGIKGRADANGANRIRGFLRNRGRLSDPLWNKFRRELFPVNHQNGRLDDVFELPYVSRPRVMAQHSVGFIRHSLDFFAVDGGKVRKEMIGENRDGPRTLT